MSLLQSYLSVSRLFGRCQASWQVGREDGVSLHANYESGDERTDEEKVSPPHLPVCLSCSFHVLSYVLQSTANKLKTELPVSKSLKELILAQFGLNYNHSVLTGPKTWRSIDPGGCRITIREASHNTN